MARGRRTPGLALGRPGRGSPSTRGPSSRPRRGVDSRDDIPVIYREMLAEARAGPSRDVGDGSAERPPKRRRPGERRSQRQTDRDERKAGDNGSSESRPENAQGGGDEGEDEDIEFEDVALPKPTIQTTYRDSEDEGDEDEDVQFEEVDFGALASSPGPDEVSQPQGLELNLTAQQAATGATPRRSAERRKPLNREEREHRIHVHKLHLLCLMAHAAQRNRWCDDSTVQGALLPLLSDKVIKDLNPSSNLSQFGQTESLKRGVEQAGNIFRTKFAISERGVRKALWADQEEHLQNYQLPDDVDSTLDKDDFREAARTLTGSRDVGAQLFCALLRSAGVEARLVCSLQPLAAMPGAPPMPKPREPKTPSKAAARAELIRASLATYDTKRDIPPAPGTIPSPRRRLGHPHAAEYHHIPGLPPPSLLPSAPRSAEESKTPKQIRGESPYPVYWVELLDVAHQKWQPVDPLVTRTQWKPQALEPPASDRANSLAYVVAFESDGSAKDVTRRYAKAYHSKTRRMRIDGFASPAANAALPAPPAASASSPLGIGANISGERWWRRVMRLYARPWPTDLDQIEANELAAAEAREPMPRNVADFKDHPLYALDRHMRRHEVLVPGAQTVGTVGAGSRAPLEKIYRRKDVRVARSRERWYRLGRVVQDGEEPVKILPRRQMTKRSLFGEEEDDTEDVDPSDLFADNAAGTPIFTLEQTDLYQAPPVVDGRVPKNKFGNLDVYVPSMVPKGGAHIAHERAAEAAHVLGIDYAPALTGFHFSGRRGTAVLTGAVVASEHEEAVRAAVAGLVEMDAEAEEEVRIAGVLRLWSRFLKGLRIRERIWAGVDLEADREDEGDEVATSKDAEDHEDKGKRVAVDEDAELEDAPSDVSEEYFMEEDDTGGGFLVD